MSQDAYGVRRLEHLIQVLAQGQFAQELQDELHGIVAALETHFQTYGGTPEGEIALKLKFRRDERAKITVAGTYAVKLPKSPAAEEILFATQDNRLTAKNPNADTMLPGVDLGRVGWRPPS